MVALGSAKCFLEAKIPRVQCKNHGVHTAKVTWAAHGSLFTRAFEYNLTHLAMHQTKKQVSKYLRVSWNTIGLVIKKVWDELKNRLPNPEDNLINIGKDETSHRKWHKYITVAVNHDTGESVRLGDGHGKETLSKFFDILTES
jgi:transposase